MKSLFLMMFAAMIVAPAMSAPATAPAAAAPAAAATKQFTPAEQKAIDVMVLSGVIAMFESHQAAQSVGTVVPDSKEGVDIAVAAAPKVIYTPELPAFIKENMQKGNQCDLDLQAAYKTGDQAKIDAAKAACKANDAEGDKALAPYGVTSDQLAEQSMNALQPVVIPKVQAALKADPTLAKDGNKMRDVVTSTMLAAAKARLAELQGK